MMKRRRHGFHAWIHCPRSACTVPTPVWTGSGSTGHCARYAVSQPLAGTPLV